MRAFRGGGAGGAGKKLSIRVWLASGFGRSALVRTIFFHFYLFFSPVDLSQFYFLILIFVVDI